MIELKKTQDYSSILCQHVGDLFMEQLVQEFVFCNCFQSDLVHLLQKKTCRSIFHKMPCTCCLAI